MRALTEWRGPAAWGLLAIALIGCAAAGLLASGFRVMRVQGEHALPALLPGEVVLWRRLAPDHAPAPGDLVVARCPGDGMLLVARVLGMPGDTIWSRSGALCRNTTCCDSTPVGRTEEANEGRLLSAQVCGTRYHLVSSNEDVPGAWAGAVAGQTPVVPEGQFLVIPDNRAGDLLRACPSWKSTIDAADLLGRPLKIVWSARWTRIGLRLE